MNKENINSESPATNTAMPARSKVTMPGLVTVGPHRSARAMIMQAVDMLETENEELRKQNEQMLEEMGRLRDENDLLRHKLSESARTNATLQTQADELRQEHKHVLQELDVERNKRLKTEEIDTQLKEENAQYLQNIGTLKKEVDEKSANLDKLSKEIQIIKERLIGNEKYLGDRDIELFHQVERLKEEKKSLQQEKEQSDKIYQSLQKGMKEVECQLDDSNAELKNENRRHALLAREFNSLLEENNQLKQQLRKRRGSVNFPNVSSSPRIEREDTMMIQRENTRLKMTGSLDNLSVIGRDSDDTSPTSRNRRTGTRENKRQLLTSSLLREGKGMKTLEQLVSGSVVEQPSRERERERYFPEPAGAMSDVVYSTRRKPLSGGSDSNNTDSTSNTPKENRRQLAPTKVSTTASVGSTTGQINASLMAGQGATTNLFTQVASTPKIISSSSVVPLPQHGNGRRGSNSPPGVTRSNTEILPSVPYLSKTWRP